MQNSEMATGRQNHNQTYEIKKKVKLLEKIHKEKEFKKNEKLRDLKRLKRRKQLERRMQNQFLQQQKDKIQNKFDEDFDRMEKLKKYLKGITQKKENFKRKMKIKINEEQYFNRLVDKVIEGEKEKEREESEKEHSKKRKKFLYEKRQEFYEKYRSKSQNNF